MQTDGMRERLFNIRMNAEESTRLESLATHYGLSAAGVVRMLLKREADAVGVTLPVAKSTKAKPRAKR